MILLTVGTMVPFDRLVQAVDRWAGDHPETEVVAQIGELGVYEPKHMKWIRMIDRTDFADLAHKSDLLIAHAGMGSFFLAAELQRPMVLFPRRAQFKEHTTDHQVHTAQWLKEKSGIYVALTEEELPDVIAHALSQSGTTIEPISPYAPKPFLDRIRQALLS